MVSKEEGGWYCILLWLLPLCLPVHMGFIIIVLELLLLVSPGIYLQNPSRLHSIWIRSFGAFKQDQQHEIVSNPLILLLLPCRSACLPAHWSLFSRVSLRRLLANRSILPSHLKTYNNTNVLLPASGYSSLHASCPRRSTTKAPTIKSSAAWHPQLSDKGEEEDEKWKMNRKC